MTIQSIREELIQKPEIIDIEGVGARLEHHKLQISVDNMFFCDCGDNWRCKIIIDPHAEDESIETFAPSLRSAMIKAFKEIEKKEL